MQIELAFGSSKNGVGEEPGYEAMQSQWGMDSSFAPMWYPGLSPDWTLIYWFYSFLQQQKKASNKKTNNQKKDTTVTYKLLHLLNNFTNGHSLLYLNSPCKEGTIPPAIVVYVKCSCRHADWNASCAVGNLKGNVLHCFLAGEAHVAVPISQSHQCSWLCKACMVRITQTMFYMVGDLL